MRVWMGGCIRRLQLRIRLGGERRILSAWRVELLRQRDDHSARHHARIALVDLVFGGFELARISTTQQFERQISMGVFQITAQHHFRHGVKREAVTVDSGAGHFRHQRQARFEQLARENVLCVYQSLLSTWQFI
jgi:hypothetical protein